MHIRSASFDTSFLLKENPLIDTILKKLVHDNIPCFITATVVSELELLKIWGRVSKKSYNRAIHRWKQTHATVIDFKNRLLADAIGKQCMVSMEKHHGVKPQDIANDCHILISSLKNGVDIFLSEDFHFTSKVSKNVVKDITNEACKEFHMMCDTHLISVNAETFFDAYKDGFIDLDLIKSRLKNIKKKGKLLYD